jgi:hypothetical protein
MVRANYTEVQASVLGLGEYDPFDLPVLLLLLLFVVVPP